MTRIIAVVSQKGGVAKTTSSINLAAELAALGQRVLLIDMDSQGHLAEGFGIPAGDLRWDISVVLDKRMELAELIETVGDNLDLAPSNIHLARLELNMVTMNRREDRLRDAVATVADRYDFILIDCPPSLGLLTVNAFSAATEVLIPMATDFYALLGVGLLMDTLGQMRREVNPDLTVLGILPTRLDKRTRHAREVIEKAASDFPETRLLEPAIPESVVVKDASGAGKPLRLFAPDSAPALAYRAVAQEILS